MRLNGSALGMVVVCCLTLAQWLAHTVRAADIVHMTNGQTMSGIVREESESYIVLQVGTGSITLPRARIARIERGDDASHERIHELWRERNWLQAQHVPPGFEELATKVRMVSARRTEAMRARTAMAADVAASRRQEDHARTLYRRLTEAASMLETLDPLNEPIRYNETVVEHNRLRAELALLAAEQPDTNRREVERSQRIHAYHQALLDARAAQTAMKTQGPLSEDSERFLARADEMLTRFDEEFSTEEIPVEQEAGGLLVTALINGRAHGRFLVDTGAFGVILTHAFADQLGLDWRALPTSSVILADGTRVQARSLRLESVQVGRFRVPDVHAAILPSAGKAHTDGLLGMSFLRHFNMTLDGQSGRMVLREFDPQRP